jgi:DNA-binding HxlR family transcriptional regulator
MVEWRKVYLLYSRVNPRAAVNELVPLPLTDLVHHRWAVPVLAVLHADEGAKVVTLGRRLGASRDTLLRTLAGLAERGLAVRNPGHGHPLRPEWIPTAAGRELGPWCARLWERVRRLGLEDVGFRKWSLPCLDALAGGARRFSELEARLAGITPRALSAALGSLEDEGLVARRVRQGRPPATVYALTPRGRRLAPLLGERPGP